MTGSVFGIASTRQKPPAAAARVPESRSSSSSRPGVRRCTWGSTKPGKGVQSLRLHHLGPAGGLDRTRCGDLGHLARRARADRAAVDAGTRIEQMCRADQQLGRRRSADESRARRRERGHGAHAGCSTVCDRASAAARRRRRPKAARRGSPSAPPGRQPPGRRSAPAATRSPRRTARRRGSPARVHQQLARLEPAAVDLEAGDVLAQRGHEGVVHPLVLHPQRVHHVGLAESSRS